MRIIYLLTTIFFTLVISCSSLDKKLQKDRVISDHEYNGECDQIESFLWGLHRWCKLLEEVDEIISDPPIRKSMGKGKQRIFKKWVFSPVSLSIDKDSHMKGLDVFDIGDGFLSGVITDNEALNFIWGKRKDPYPEIDFTRYMIIFITKCSREEIRVIDVDSIELVEGKLKITVRAAERGIIDDLRPLWNLCLALVGKVDAPAFFERNRLTPWEEELKKLEQSLEGK
jgi:hypothetical protein